MRSTNVVSQPIDESTRGKFLMLFLYPFLSQVADNIAGHIVCLEQKMSFRQIFYFSEQLLKIFFNWGVGRGENKGQMKCTFVFVLDIKYSDLLQGIAVQIFLNSWKTIQRKD